MPSSGSEKFKWSRESALAVVNQLRENGSSQYTALKDSFGEKLVDEMFKEHFLVYQPLPSLVDNNAEDLSLYPIGPALKLCTRVCFSLLQMHFVAMR